MIKGVLVYFTYQFLAQGGGGSELIREGLMEEADLTPNLKHENEGWKAQQRQAWEGG